MHLAGPDVHSANRAGVVGAGGDAVAASAQFERLRYRVLATAAQRLATGDAPCGEDAAPQRSEARQGNPCIIRATGVEATALPQQGAEPAFVQAEQKKQESGQDSSRGQDGWRFVVHLSIPEARLLV